MIETKDQLEAVITNLKFILQNCHVTSGLYVPIWTFQDAMTFEGNVRRMTISDGRNELLRCVHDEEDHNNRDTAERLRDVLRSMEGCSDCRG